MPGVWGEAEPSPSQGIPWRELRAGGEMELPFFGTPPLPNHICWQPSCRVAGSQCAPEPAKEAEQSFSSSEITRY